MAQSVNEKSRHLYYDQQQPREQLGRPIIQGMLARREPTREDEFFFEREKSIEDRQGAMRRSETEEPGIAATAESTQTKEASRGIWKRFSRALFWKANTRWRP